MLERPDAGNGFDATYAGGNGFFADDFEHANVANAAYMGAAAEFFRVEAARGTLIGNGDHAHVGFRIFVAKESQSARSQGVVERSDVGFDLRVVADFLVCLLLDVAQLFRIDRGKV